MCLYVDVPACMYICIYVYKCVYMFVHMCDHVYTWVWEREARINPSGPTRVFTDHFTDHFFFFFLARSSRVGDFKENTRTPHARSCTAPQSNAVPAKGQQKTLKPKIYKKGKSFH